MSIKDCTQRPFGSLSKGRLPTRLRWLATPLSAGAIASFGLLIAHRGLGFVAAFALAALLGASGYGVYSFAVSCAGLMMVPALLGTEGLLVREVAVYRHNGQWALIRGLLLQSARFVLGAALGVAGLAAILGFVQPQFIAGELLPAWWFGIAIMPILAFSYLMQAAMKGLGHVLLGQVPIFAIKPLLFAGAIGVVWLLGPAHASSVGILFLYAVTYGCALLFAIWQLIRHLPVQVQHATAEYMTRAWALSAGPMLVISIVQIANVHADVIMIGGMLGAEPAGVFGLSNTTAFLISTPLTAVNAVLGPTIATAYAAKDWARLQRMATRAARAVFAISLGPALVFLFFGEELLALFGPEFAGGAQTLAILIVGHVFNVLMGSVGLILLMTGRERDVAVATSLGTGLHVVLNLILIPLWGIQGAATAAATTIVVMHGMMACQAYIRLGIDVTAFGFFARSRGE